MGHIPDSWDMFPTTVRCSRERLSKVFFFENVKVLLRAWLLLTIVNNCECGYHRLKSISRAFWLLPTSIIGHIARYVPSPVWRNPLATGDPKLTFLMTPL